MKMAKCTCSKEVFRILLWMSWVANTLFSSVYIILSLWTFSQLLQASSGTTFDVTELALNSIWRAPLAATILSVLLVFGFNMLSCIILCKRSINRSGPGFGYGFVVAFCGCLAFFCLLVGLVLDGFRPVVEETFESTDFMDWSTYSSDVFIATEAFAFLTFCLFFGFFLTLIIFQAAVSEQLGIPQEETHLPYTPMELPFNFMSQNKDPAAAYAQPGYDQYAQEGMYNADGQYMQYNQEGYGTSDQAGYSAAYYGAGATYGENDQLYNAGATGYGSQYGAAATYDAYGQGAAPSVAAYATSAPVPTSAPNYGGLEVAPSEPAVPIAAPASHHEPSSLEAGARIDPSPAPAAAASGKTADLL